MATTVTTMVVTLAVAVAAAMLANFVIRPRLLVIGVRRWMTRSSAAALTLGLASMACVNVRPAGRGHLVMSV